MAELSLTDAFCYSAGYDFTTDTNSATLTTDVAALDATTFGSSGWQEFIAGLKSYNLAWSGFWQAAAGGQAVDNQAFSALSTSQVYTIGANEAEAANGRAYMFEATKSQYTLGGQVGDIAPFSLSAVGSGGTSGVVRGQLAKAKGEATATGALGSPVLLGALGSDSVYLYATFHVFTAGTTITIDVESDDNSDFSSPTTVATIGPLTTSGGTWMPRVQGPITDNWFRFKVTAITGTFVVAGALGRQ